MMRATWVLCALATTACDAGPALELDVGAWTLTVSADDGQGEPTLEWYVDGSGAVDLVFAPLYDPPIEECLGTIDAAAVASLTAIMNDLDMLSRGGSSVDGDDVSGVHYVVRATGGPAAGRGNGFRDEAGDADELFDAIETSARAQVACVRNDP